MNHQLRWPSDIEIHLGILLSHECMDEMLFIFTIFGTRFFLVTYNAIFALHGKFLESQPTKGVDIVVMSTLLKQTCKRL